MKEKSDFLKAWGKTRKIYWLYCELVEVVWSRKMGLNHRICEYCAISVYVRLKHEDINEYDYDVWTSVDKRMTSDQQETCQTNVFKASHVRVLDILQHRSELMSYLIKHSLEVVGECVWKSFKELFFAWQTTSLTAVSSIILGLLEAFDNELLKHCILSNCEVESHDKRR